jgi:AAA domain
VKIKAFDPQDYPLPEDHPFTRDEGRARARSNGQDGLLGDPSARQKLEIEMLTDITEEAIDWLWPGWLAKRKFHLIAGRPSAGKSTLAFSFAATISAGNYWPDGTRAPVTHQCSGPRRPWREKISE